MEKAYACEEKLENGGFEDCVRFLFNGYPSNSQDDKPIGLRGKKCNIKLPPIRNQAQNQVLDNIPIQMQGAAALPLDSTVTNDLIDWEDEEDWTKPKPPCSLSWTLSILDMQEEQEEGEQEAPKNQPLQPVSPLPSQNSPMDWRHPDWRPKTWSGKPKREPNASKTKYLDVGYCKRCGEIGGHWKGADCKASSAERAQYADSLDTDTEFPYKMKHRESRYQKNQQRLRMISARGTSMELVELRKYQEMKARHTIMIQRQAMNDLGMEMRFWGENKNAIIMEEMIEERLQMMEERRFDGHAVSNLLEEIKAIMKQYQRD